LCYQTNHYYFKILTEVSLFRIGRVTEGLLVDIADQVDIIEPVVKFTNVLQGKSGVRNIFNIGLEEWQPLQETQYDLVWAQWCVGYLTDKQLVQHLERCKEALVQDSGIIVIKENLSTSGQDYFDPSDSSITRYDPITSIKNSRLG